jgi:hypothetical protein
MERNLDEKASEGCRIRALRGQHSAKLVDPERRLTSVQDDMAVRADRSQLRDGIDLVVLATAFGDRLDVVHLNHALCDPRGRVVAKLERRAGAARSALSVSQTQNKAQTRL